MSDLKLAFFTSIEKILNLESEYLFIVLTSLEVSLVAILISSIISASIASFLSMKKFYGRSVIIIFFNTMMSLPPVVVGLLLYILFANQGMFGSHNLLYTTNIMIIAQIVLITPILISLSKETIDRYFNEYNEFLISIHAPFMMRLLTLIWEARYVLITNLLVGLGRALSEVGAIIIVGGNIYNLARTMTTGIVLETSRGDLTMALSLGITLIFIAIAINIILYLFKIYGEKKYA